jgi:hypothetical protein
MEETHMRTLLSTALITSSLIVGAAAHGQQPPTPSPAQPPASAQPAKMTISGCIQTPAPEAPAAGATAPAPTPSTSKFDLANAKMVGTAPVGTSGAATATRYKLEGDEKTISTHLNHQVEITGTVSPATAGAAAAAPTLKVDAVKMIAAKCS